MAQLPEQPDGRHARRWSSTSDAAALARRHGFVVASDEAYSELYFGDAPPASALQVADRAHVAVFNTLSKRSSMPGYRSGFVAGDPEIIAALKRYRPNAGVAPQEFVQRAAVAAWGDEAHVDEVRERYRAKRDALLPALEAAGLRSAGGDATFFLWLDAGPDADAYAAELLEKGVVLTPGSFFGEAGAGYLRLALVPPPEVCAPGGRDHQSFACSAALRPAQRPERGSASTVPVRELRRNSRPFAPLSSRALTTSPSGSVISVPAVT